MTESTWWRWPLLPFAAVGGGMAASVAAALFFWLSAKFAGFGEEGWYFRYIVPLFVSGVFGHVFVRITCGMAPQGKVIAGTVMVTILGVFCLLSAVLAWYMPDYSTGFAIQNTVGSIAMMFGAVVTLQDVVSDVRAASPPASVNTW